METCDKVKEVIDDLELMGLNHGQVEQMKLSGTELFKRSEMPIMIRKEM